MCPCVLSIYTYLYKCILMPCVFLSCVSLYVECALCCVYVCSCTQGVFCVFVDCISMCAVYSCVSVCASVAFLCVSLRTCVSINTGYVLCMGRIVYVCMCAVFLCCVFMCVLDVPCTLYVHVSVCVITPRVCVTTPVLCAHAPVCCVCPSMCKQVYPCACEHTWQESGPGCAHCPKAV